MSALTTEILIILGVYKRHSRVAPAGKHAVMSLIPDAKGKKKKRHAIFLA